MVERRAMRESSNSRLVGTSPTTRIAHVNVSGARTCGSFGSEDIRMH